MRTEPNPAIVVALDGQTIDAIAARIVERMQAAPARPEPILCDMREAARLLGISVEAVKKRMQNHTMPKGSVVRTGRRIYFKLEALRQIKASR